MTELETAVCAWFAGPRNMTKEFFDQGVGYVAAKTGRPIDDSLIADIKKVIDSALID